MAMVATLISPTREGDGGLIWQRHTGPRPHTTVQLKPGVEEVGGVGQRVVHIGEDTVGLELW